MINNRATRKQYILALLLSLSTLYTSGSNLVVDLFNKPMADVPQKFKELSTSAAKQAKQKIDQSKDAAVKATYGFTYNNILSPLGSFIKEHKALTGAVASWMAYYVWSLLKVSSIENEYASIFTHNVLQQLNLANPNVQQRLKNLSKSGKQQYVQQALGLALYQEFVTTITEKVDKYVGDYKESLKELYEKNAYEKKKHIYFNQRLQHDINILTYISWFVSSIYFASGAVPSYSWQTKKVTIAQPFIMAALRSRVNREIELLTILQAVLEKGLQAYKDETSDDKTPQQLVEEYKEAANLEKRKAQAAVRLKEAEAQAAELKAQQAEKALEQQQEK